MSAIEVPIGWGMDGYLIVKTCQKKQRQKSKIVVKLSKIILSSDWQSLTCCWSQRCWREVLPQDLASVLDQESLETLKHNRLKKKNKNEVEAEPSIELVEYTCWVYNMSTEQKKTWNEVEGKPSIDEVLAAPLPASPPTDPGNHHVRQLWCWYWQ